MMEPILPDPDGVAFDEIQITHHGVEISLSADRPFGCCPLCHSRRAPGSERVHSRYTRTLADLPWQGAAVRLRLCVRRFLCETVACPRRIFAERVAKVAAPHARTTCRLDEALESIAFTCGGEAGARLASRLAMPTSPDTLSRRM